MKKPPAAVAKIYHFFLATIHHNFFIAVSKWKAFSYVRQQITFLATGNIPYFNSELKPNTYKFMDLQVQR